tara:strand:+ start:501 stop:674 length:174 start_codon:yes stop_codon:yes gene_type:complete
MIKKGKLSYPWGLLVLVVKIIIKYRFMQNRNVWNSVGQMINAINTRFIFGDTRRMDE